jgi:hypothetical protein
VQKYWAEVKNLQNQIFSMFGQGAFAFGMYMVKKHLLNYSWRKMILYSIVALNLVDVCFVLPTVTGALRSQYFYLGETVMGQLPYAVQFLFQGFVAVEMAEKGNEGMVFGLLTTMHNLGLPFAQALANQIFGQFPDSLSDADNYIRDTDSFRTQVAWSFVLTWFFHLVCLASLPLLPDQKKEAQKWKATWPSSPVYGKITVSLIAFAWFYAITISMLAMFPNTMCLEIAGGDGCDSEQQP